MAYLYGKGLATCASQLGSVLSNPSIVGDIPFFHGGIRYDMRYYGYMRLQYNISIFRFNCTFKKKGWFSHEKLSSTMGVWWISPAKEAARGAERGSYQLPGRYCTQARARALRRWAGLPGLPMVTFQPWWFSIANCQILSETCTDSHVSMGNPSFSMGNPAFLWR